MYPPVGLGQVRVNAKRDLTLAGGRLCIPAGTALWVPHHAMHNAKHNWDHPEEFLPGARLAPFHALADGVQREAGSNLPAWCQQLAPCCNSSPSGHLGMRGCSKSSASCCAFCGCAVGRRSGRLTSQW